MCQKCQWTVLGRCLWVSRPCGTLRRTAPRAVSFASSRREDYRGCSSRTGLATRRAGRKQASGGCRLDAVALDEHATLKKACRARNFHLPDLPVICRFAPEEKKRCRGAFAPRV